MPPDPPFTPFDPPPATAPPIPPELMARMDALDALALAAWSHALEWDVDWNPETGKFRCYARDNLTEINLEYPYK